ncbi:MAG: PTS sugar transporter subunit IIA [Oscillospiraceae bacterium]
MITKLIGNDNFLPNVKCKTWEQLVDIAGKPLIDEGAVEPQFLDSIKETVERYGAYMILVDDIAFFHGRPEAGVHRVAMSLAILDEPVYLLKKRVKSAFVFAAVDNDSHKNLLRELARSLQDEEFLSLLRNKGSKDEILNKLREVEKNEV